MHYDDSSHKGTLKFLADKKLILLDIDGTLVLNFNSTDLKPGVAKALQILAEDPARQFALVTNQGGPAARDAPWVENPEKYPTVEDVQRRVDTIASHVSRLVDPLPVRTFINLAYQGKDGNIYIPISLDPSDPRCDPAGRKPQPGMILAAIKATGIPAEQAIIIGDSQTDWEAGENAGIDSMSSFSLESLGRTHYDLKITVPTGYLWGWLEDSEQAGLNEAETRLAFEAELGRQYEHIESIESFQVEFTDSDGDDGITIHPPELADDGLINRPIHDTFINCEWLRYESAEAHAAGVVNHDTLRAILPLALERIYHLSNTEARRVADEAVAAISPAQIRRKVFNLHAATLRSLLTDYQKVFNDDDAAILIAAIKLLESKAAGS